MRQLDASRICVTALLIRLDNLADHPGVRLLERAEDTQQHLFLRIIISGCQFVVQVRFCNGG